jgi:hypothetical protein
MKPGLVPKYSFGLIRCLRAGMPTMGALRGYAEAGVLMSYGPSYMDHCRRAATYSAVCFHAVMVCHQSPRRF